MLNEDQASCELLYIRKMSSKQQRCSMLLEDSGVSESLTQHPKKTIEINGEAGLHCTSILGINIYGTVVDQLNWIKLVSGKIMKDLAY